LSENFNENSSNLTHNQSKSKSKTSPTLNKRHVYKIRNKYENNINGDESNNNNSNNNNNDNTGKTINRHHSIEKTPASYLSSLKKTNSIHVSKYANDNDDGEASLKSEKSKQKFKYQINLTGSLNYKENKFSNTSSIRQKSLSSATYEKKSHDTIGNSRKKLAAQKHVESFCSSSITSSSSSSSINTSASSSSLSKASSQRKSKKNSTDAAAAAAAAVLPNVEKLKLTESNDKQQQITKQVFIEMVNDKNRLSKNELEQKATSNKTLIDRIKKFTPSIATNSSASMMPTLSSEFNSKLNKFINANSKVSHSKPLTSNNLTVTRTESSERQVKGLNIISNSNKIAPMVKSKDLNEDMTQHATTTSADAIKIESNKVKDIIKCFNSIEKRTSDLNNNSINTTTITASNATSTTTSNSNNNNSNKQNVSQTLRTSTSHNENHESPIPFPKSDQNHATLDAQSINSKAKFIANNITKMKSSISFSQHGKFKLF